MSYFTKSDQEFRDRMAQLDADMIEKKKQAEKEGVNTESRLHYYKERDKINEEIIGNLQGENAQLKARVAELEAGIVEAGERIE